MVGFEPTPSERNWFLVNRLNRSATSADVCVPPGFKHIQVRKNSLWSNLIMPLIPKWRDPLDAPGQPNRGGNFRLFSSQVIFNEDKQIRANLIEMHKIVKTGRCKTIKKLQKAIWKRYTLFRQSMWTVPHFPNKRSSHSQSKKVLSREDKNIQTFTNFHSWKVGTTLV